jgi:hypothetical protein
MNTTLPLNWFVKKEQREMFMTFPTDDIRFKWLSRKYNDKYENK